MSKYTTELRFICETLANKTESVGYDKIDEVVDEALPKLFDFDFPLFDEAYRTVLEKKIVLHYYTREICAETVGLWKLFLRRRLNEIMPYYNQLYKTELIEFNPLYDIDLTRQRNTTGNEAGKGSNTGTSNAKNTSNKSENGTSSRDTKSTGKEDNTATSQNTVISSNKVTDENDTTRAFSDTPNNKLNNVQMLDYLTTLSRDQIKDEQNTTGNTHDTTTGSEQKENEYEQNVEGSYENNGTETNTGTQTNTGSYTTSLDTTEQYIETVRGSSGGASYAKRIAEFRKNILNIDMDVIRELDDLFFGLW
jgi:hypothetical protein